MSEDRMKCEFIKDLASVEKIEVVPVLPILG